MQVSFTLVGQTPLLMHADNIEFSDYVSAWRKNPANKNVSIAGDDRSPGFTWLGYTYNDGNHVAMPAENIMVCLRQAGAKVIMSKQKTYKEITQSGMLIDSEHCKFLTLGKQIAFLDLYALKELSFEEQADTVRNNYGFRLWCKRASINGRSKNVRVRPRFDNWSVSGRLNVMATKELTQPVLTQLFELAGRVGLGDWRPGCKTPGPFGMFEAKLDFQK